MLTFEIHRATGVAEIRVPVRKPTKSTTFSVEFQFTKALFDKKLIRAIVKEVGKKDDTAFIKMVEKTLRDGGNAILQHSDYRIEYCDGDRGVMTILFNVKNFIESELLAMWKREAKNHIDGLKKKPRFRKVRSW